MYHLTVLVLNQCATVHHLHLYMLNICEHLTHVLRFLIPDYQQHKASFTFTIHNTYTQPKGRLLLSYNKKVVSFLQ